MKRVVLALSMAAFVAGCGGLKSSRPAEQVYVLHAVAAAAADAGAAAGASTVAGVLRVPRPEVQPGLDSARIALTRGGNELDYFADSRWGESLPKVLAAFAVESLSRSGEFGTVVGAASSTVPVDFELLLTVRHFEAAYGAGVPVARVAFDCVLLGGAPRHVLGRCDAEAEEDAGENRLAPIVAALERAARKAMADAGRRAATLARSVRK